MTLAALWHEGDWLTRSIALLLLLMSVSSWYLIATRTMRLLRFRREVMAAQAFWAAADFSEGIRRMRAAHPESALLALAIEGDRALRQHQAGETSLKSRFPLADWLAESLKGAIDEALVHLQSGLSLLASIGSTAPFIGLLGTVWGIYHALIRIGASGQASIDQIAGPVGEALIMTALGLAVAIPAVLAYNAFVRANRRALGQLNRFARQLHAYLLGIPAEEA